MALISGYRMRRRRVNVTPASHVEGGLGEPDSRLAGQIDA